MNETGPAPARHALPPLGRWDILCGLGAGILLITLGWSLLGSVFTARLPLRDVTAVIADSQGRMYAAMSAPSRVQVYDQDGGFLYAIPAPASKEPVLIAIDEHDRLWTLFSGRTVDRWGGEKKAFELKLIDDGMTLVSHLVRLQLDGTAVQQRWTEGSSNGGHVVRDGDPLFQRGAQRVWIAPRTFTSPAGTSYSMYESKGVSFLRRIAPDGTSILFGDPLWLRLLAVPVPAIIVGTILLVVGAIGSRRARAILGRWVAWIRMPPDPMTTR